MLWKIVSLVWGLVWFIPCYILSLLWYLIWECCSLFGKLLFPDYNFRKVKALVPIIKQINELRDVFMKLSNVELNNKTKEFKERLYKGASLDDILIEAFATVKEAVRRVAGMEHYDEQLMAGIALHRGFMTEMKTGEGKTLAATTAVYLNALTGKGVHVATVNDYLAKRDAEEMGRIYSFLGLTCGVLLENMSIAERQAIYALDIVYAMGSTFGFDYLHDNMAMSVKNVCQRELFFVIVDEADKLIDDGRTPLIISNASDENLDYYSYLIDIVRQLNPEDYEIERSERSVTFSESGLAKINDILQKDGVVQEGETLYSSGQLNLIHGLNQCLHAQVMMKKNVDYIISKNRTILLVDEHTGRILEGRRLSHGLHQAIEAKEGVTIQREGKTSASISYQKFFGLYKKFSGMSGTCLSEAEEFYEIYGVDTISIPTHKPIIRIDEEDEIYLDFDDKFEAIVKTVKEANEKQQPVLLITGSVEFSEIFAKKFDELNWKYNILNAKRHKEEADIIAQAGMPGAITIATNMAGRGTDIQLGGNLDMHVRRMRENGLSESEIEAQKTIIKEEIKRAKKIVLDAGGLFVIGTERNESRRVDDQARGRAGRQGDPGRSKFMISLDDTLMKNFSNQNLLRRVMTKGEAIYDPLITRQVAKAQRAVEARNFDQRKYLLKYDSVLDEQRLMIYNFRKKYLYDDDLTYQLEKFINEKINILKVRPSSIGDFNRLFGVSADNIEESQKLVLEKTKSINVSFFKRVLLTTLDDLWSMHLSNLSHVQHITGLRAHGQKDPLTEYKIEASKLFENLLERFVNESLYKIFNTVDDNSVLDEEEWLEEMSSMVERLKASLLNEENSIKPLTTENLIEINKNVEKKNDDFNKSQISSSFEEIDSSLDKKKSKKFLKSEKNNELENKKNSKEKSDNKLHNKKFVKIPDRKKVESKKKDQEPLINNEDIEKDKE